MALEKNYTTVHGLDCPCFYLIVTEARYSKGQESQGTIAGYRDMQARDLDLQPLLISHFGFKFDVNSPKNIITQAYEQVKLDPFYADAIDV